MEQAADMKISLVCDHLAIGSRVSAENKAALLNHEIGAVLSLTATTPGLQIPQHTVLIQDRIPLPGAAIQDCMEFIEDQQRQGRRVLIHCEMGISRSPAIAACFLHESLGLPLTEAHYLIKRQRPIAEPHPVLVASIQEYYHEHGRLTSPGYGGSP